MHRSIHKLFTGGFLADAKKLCPACDDPRLWTQLTLVLNGDGSLDRVEIRRRSGVVAFDAAAVDAVTQAAPFPPPPPVIRSADGKVHLDWQFHRDPRGCGTFGVDPHILEDGRI
jgi:TonB family protein